MSVAPLSSLEATRIPTGALFRFQRHQRAQIGDDRIEIVGRDLGVPVASHCAAQWRPVGTNARTDGSLDIVVAPSADPVLGIGGDIAADGLRPRVSEIGQLAPARRASAHIWPAGPRGSVAAQAMPDGSCPIAAVR